MADGPVRVACAGRTDTGVHGFAQVVHFDAPVSRSSKSWVLGTNANLPFDVRVHWAVPVPPDFHARFAAKGKTYEEAMTHLLKLMREGWAAKERGL